MISIALRASKLQFDTTAPRPRLRFRRPFVHLPVDREIGSTHPFTTYACPHLLGLATNREPLGMIINDIHNSRSCDNARNSILFGTFRWRDLDAMRRNAYEPKVSSDTSLQGKNECGKWLRRSNRAVTLSSWDIHPDSRES